MTADGSRVSFGIKTSQSNISYAEILKIWREADTVPVIEHAWLWDHLVPLRGDVTGAALEAWTLLAALAAQTSRLRLGVIVTSNRIRPPAVLAKMAATGDDVDGGRLVLGIGAGGSALADPAYRDMVHREYDAYGIDVVSPGEAVAALAEACTIVKRMWSEDQPFDFDGRCYQLKGAICEPKPVQRPRPPIMIGAGGERSALRVVAEHADICPARPGRPRSSGTRARCSMTTAPPSAGIRHGSPAPRRSSSPRETPQPARASPGPPPPAT
jgi:alkanesulfonate monooxygenase SsuD/methylene tetrahydromethanopterin reductase-like flavin-dependent oxidoreductase (luciferase family)